jgi:hypothetical protein
MSVFTGLTDDAKRASLLSLQAAYLELLAGSKVAAASYTQGDGAKSVTFSQANLGNLTALIAQLQAELGMICRPRRTMRFLHR